MYKKNVWNRFKLTSHNFEEVLENWNIKFILKTGFVIN